MHPDPTPTSGTAVPPWQKQTVSYQPYSYSQGDVYNTQLCTYTGHVSTPIFRPPSHLYPYIPTGQQQTLNSYCNPSPPGPPYTAPNYGMDSHSTPFLQPHTQTAVLDTSTSSDSNSSSIDVVTQSQANSGSMNEVLMPPIVDDRDDNYRSIHQELLERRQLAEEWNVFPRSTSEDNGNSITEATERLTRQLWADLHESGVMRSESNTNDSAININTNNYNRDGHAERVSYLESTWNEVSTAATSQENTTMTYTESTQHSRPRTPDRTDGTDGDNCQHQGGRIPLNTVYMDTLQRLESSRNNLYDAFAEARVVDSTGTPVTTDDILQATANDTNANDRLELDVGQDFRSRFPTFTRELERESSFTPISMSDCPKPKTSMQPRTIQTEGTFFPQGENNTKSSRSTSKNHSNSGVRTRPCHDELSRRTNGLLESIEEEPESQNTSSRDPLEQYREEQRKKWKSTQAVVQPMVRSNDIKKKEKNSQRSTARSARASSASFISPVARTRAPSTSSGRRSPVNSGMSSGRTSAVNSSSTSPIISPTSSATVASSSNRSVYSEHNYNQEANNGQPVQADDDNYQYVDLTYGKYLPINVHINLNDWLKNMNLSLTIDNI